MNQAVFLDRDGTLIREREYLADPAGVELVSGAGPALRRLAEAGFLLYIVTNQSGIGRGYYSEADMHRVNQRLTELLAAQGAPIRQIYFAPEAPEQPSRGRKPSPFFLLQARDAYGLDLARCHMVGDKRSDLECGWNAGLRLSFLVRTGYGAQAEAALAAHPPAGPTRIVDDIAQAADVILSLPPVPSQRD